MAHLIINKTNSDDSMPTEILDGLMFAQTAIQFASLGLTAGKASWTTPQVHLYALAIELAFKSLAIRSGATVQECKKAGHRVSRMIALIEGKGTFVTERIKTRLSDDIWFNSFLFLSRYPTFTNRNTSLENTIFLHSDYPQMIATILEVPCKWQLGFNEGSALCEITGVPKGNSL